MLHSSSQVCESVRISTTSLEFSIFSYHSRFSPQKQNEIWVKFSIKKNIAKLRFKKKFKIGYTFFRYVLDFCIVVVVISQICQFFLFFFPMGDLLPPQTGLKETIIIQVSVSHYQLNNFANNRCNSREHYHGQFYLSYITHHSQMFKIILSLGMNSRLVREFT